MTTAPVEVRVLPDDLLRVLAGHAITVHGGFVLRLFTAEEWLPLQHAACDELRVPQNKVGMERARQLTQPIDLVARLGGESHG
jgi:hypothetical protein